MQREQCAEDGRGWLAVLTDAGFERLREVCPADLASVRRHVTDYLMDAVLPGFAAALERFVPSTTPADR